MFPTSFTAKNGAVHYRAVARAGAGAGAGARAGAGAGAGARAGAVARAGAGARAGAEKSYCKCTLYIFRMIRRTKTKYFNNGKLIWEENTSAGKYVRENCKILKVSAGQWAVHCCQVAENLAKYMKRGT